MVKLYVPLTVGVPEITPVAAFNVKPTGRVPRVRLQVSGEVPPVEVRV